MLWDPIRYVETCPSSDGACAHGARPTRPAATPRRRRPPAWVHGTADAQRADDVRRPRPGAARRPASDCAADVYRRPASPTRRSEIDCAEMYVPF